MPSSLSSSSFSLSGPMPSSSILRLSSSSSRSLTTFGWKSTIYIGKMPVKMEHKIIKPLGWRWISVARLDGVAHALDARRHGGEALLTLHRRRRDDKVRRRDQVNLKQNFFNAFSKIENPKSQFLTTNFDGKFFGRALKALFERRFHCVNALIGVTADVNI